MTFEDLVNKVSPKLKGIVYKLNTHCSFLNDKDLLQESLLYLWVEFKEGNLSGHTDSYILQGCYFYLKNYLRKFRDRGRLISIEGLVNEEGADLEEVLSWQHYKPGAEIIQLDNKILVDKIRNNGLTDREKQVFILWLEGLTTREIGRKLDISHVRVVRLQNSIKEKCQKYRN
jgi:RNA polymerase sigma factor (sigma-70 family)